LAGGAIRRAGRARGPWNGRGRAHRDVRPATLLPARGPARPGLPGGPPLIKLLDLGLSCALRSTGREDAPADELCGAPDYMAPERGMGEAPPDLRGDLYSLGCTFYHLLTGRVPFPGGNWTSKLLRHRLEAPAPLRS